MGGVSKGTMVRDAVAGRAAIRMRGDLSLENNGGFVQIALDLSPYGGVVDASAWSGIELDVFGNGEEYGVHLRTDALTRPWQSYRQIFSAYAEWRTVQLPFDHFVPHRTDVLLDTAPSPALSPDRGVAGFATLQADVVAAMAKAGQRGARGMRQPPGGGDQLFQLRALIALEQFDHPRDLRALAGRRRCWCGRRARGRRHICCGLRFRRILVRVLRNGRAEYGL